MFDKWLGKDSADTKIEKDSEEDASAEAMARLIAEKKKDDPLIEVKIGARAFLEQLMGVMRTDRGVHIESALAVLGALGGFSCQMSVRELNPGVDEKDLFLVVNTGNDTKFMFGDRLNAPLVEDQYSFWSLTAGGAKRAGLDIIPSLDNIFEHVATTIGGPDFGVPRIPEDHAPSELPIVYVRDMWAFVKTALNAYCDTSSQWPVFFGLAVQETIVLGKDVIDPSLALRIVMECAIPMSKIDPAALFTTVKFTTND